MLLSWIDKTPLLHLNYKIEEMHANMKLGSIMATQLSPFVSQASLSSGDTLTPAFGLDDDTALDLTPADSARNTKSAPFSVASVYILYYSPSSLRSTLYTLPFVGHIQFWNKMKFIFDVLGYS